MFPVDQMHRCGIILISIALPAALSGCSGGESDTPGPDGPLVLPEEFYGAWDMIGASGGIDGRSIPAERPTQIVIHQDNRIEVFVSGQLIATQSFEVSRGKSIYSSKLQWFIQRKDDVQPQVISVASDSLAISDNVYDGFSTSYRRAKE